MSATITTMHTPAIANIDGLIATVRSVATRVHTFFVQSAEHRERAYEEAYLAESVDRYDLEFRMRELARANPQPYWMSGLGR